MSEEILRALMEMFAMVVKHDGGMLRSELNYVSDFLSRQLPYENVDEYLKLFLGSAGRVRRSADTDEEGKPSSKDSVRIFNICQTINKTLTQKQKVVVLIRVFELVEAGKRYTQQRLNIITTIAEVFRIPREETELVRSFVCDSKAGNFSNPLFLWLDPDGKKCSDSGDSSMFLFLKIPSVNLYFLRSFSDDIAWLNGMQITPGKVYAWAPGGTLSVPPHPSIYYSDIISDYGSGGDTPLLTFVADHLSYSFPDKAIAINDVSFSATGGQLVGIMGTSGTGKTTLLNILSGLLRPDRGDIRINGRSLFPPGQAPDGVIGFVPQDDLLIEDLTVFENLFYTASLCYGNKNKKEVTDIVNQMLRSMGLYEIRALKVGSPLGRVISGGQRKRLNIALELIREPSLLFLDEPTSGLSSRDSAYIMDLVHDLTLKGKLVITVIHQPSSEIFKGFEKVLILDQDGQMAYYGNPVEAVIYFKTQARQINNEHGECQACGNINPETIFNIIDERVVDEFGQYTEKRKVTAEEWAHSFRSVSRYATPEETHPPVASSISRPGWIRQTMLYIARDVRAKTANRQYMVLILSEGPLLGLILSYIIRYIADPASDNYIFRENENIPIYIFMSVIVALFLGLTISAEEIFRDRKILAREYFLSLSRGSYLTAKISVLTVVSALQILLFLIVANPVLEIRDLFPAYWLALFTTAICACLIGLNVSSAFRSAVAIYISIPLLMIPMMVLSGAMFPFDKLNRNIGSVGKVPVIAEMMPTRWTYEALMVKQYTGNEYEKLVYDLKQQISNSDFTAVYRIPKIREALDETIEQVSSGKTDSYTRLALVSNEVKRLSNAGIATPFPGSDSLTPDLFTRSLGLRLSEWLEESNKEYVRRGNMADSNLDNFINDNRSYISGIYDGCHNDKLEEIMRKYYEKNKILEYRNRLIQNIDPIYLEPESGSIPQFRAHFMAPAKIFMGKKTDTFAFNIILVLLSSVVLYIILYFEVLKKLITFIEDVDNQKK